jgi:hypothetical protein
MRRMTLKQLVEKGMDLGDIDFLVKRMGLKYGKKSGTTVLTLHLDTALDIIYERREARERYRR